MSAPKKAEEYVLRAKQLILLQNMGFQQLYIERACAIYEKTYNNESYTSDTAVIRSILRRLHHKDRLKLFKNEFEKRDTNNYIMTDTFYKIGNHMSLRNYNEDIQGILMILNNWNTAYGNYVISPIDKNKEMNEEQSKAIYQWTIKIKQQKQQNSKIIIGIVTRRDNENNKHMAYGYCNHGQTIHFDSLQNYAVSYTNNDIIKMELNVCTKTLKYYKNNKDLGVAFENINLKKNAFCLAISLNGYVEVKLIKFKCCIANTNAQINTINNNNTNITEQKLSKQLKEQNKKLNKLSKEMNDSLLLTENTLQMQQTEMAELQMQIKTLKNAQKEIE